jgi:hypothetical protein
MYEHHIVTGRSTHYFSLFPLNVPVPSVRLVRVLSAGDWPVSYSCVCCTQARHVGLTKRRIQGTCDFPTKACVFPTKACDFHTNVCAAPWCAGDWPDAYSSV